ncbi:putative F-box/LRR-repeat protein 23 [Salvia divinorum]|uniref:F-box/LRR-repeat protein 23 n=1 Tax=Salvia divinorum TaxID=28513 RepID=A0ABD1HH46_SALDI
MLSTGKKSESSKPIITIEPSIEFSSAPPPPPPSPPWNELPDDLTANILQRLDAEERLESAQLVCSTWWRVCKNPAMWRVIDVCISRCEYNKFDNICCRAVDRSQGQLVELKIAGPLSGWLIYYVAVRSSQLRRLTLEGLCTVDLSEAIEILPQLKELHLYMMNTLDPEDVETIGIACPMLKSFTYCNDCADHPEFSDHAVAIGNTMPNLSHLQINGLLLENSGLEAILNGCPNLELLDLGECSGLDLRGDLGARCFEQIKDVRLPNLCRDLDNDSELSDYWNPNYDDNYSIGDCEYEYDI